MATAALRCSSGRGVVASAIADQEIPDGPDAASTAPPVADEPVPFSARVEATGRQIRELRARLALLQRDAQAFGAYVEGLRTDGTERRRQADALLSAWSAPTPAGRPIRFRSFPLPE